MTRDDWFELLFMAFATYCTVAQIEYVYREWKFGEEA